MPASKYNDLIDSAINPNGGDPKIEGRALSGLLKNLAGALSAPVPAAVACSYAQLLALATAGQLVPGQAYLLTDWQLTHTIARTSATHTSEVEPLLLWASTPTALAPQGYSALYPEDVVYYTLDNADVRMPGATKGHVFRRVDTRRDNDLEIDFRHVVFRRWYDAGAGAYTVATDNGAAFADFPLLDPATYPQGNSFANKWRGFDPRGAIFNAVNFVAVGDVKIRGIDAFNTPLLDVTVIDGRIVTLQAANSKFSDVVITGGGYLASTVLTSSTLTGLRLRKAGFFCQLEVTLLNSALTNRVITNEYDHGGVLINSQVDNTNTSGLTIINNAVHRTVTTAEV